MRRIAELYVVKATIRGRSADERRRFRAVAARPLVESSTPGSKLNCTSLGKGHAAAIRYAFTRWPALCRFLEDGGVELDTNTVERAIRQIAPGRKHHMFVDPMAGPTAGPSSLP